MEVFEMKLKKKSFFDEDDENLDPERRKMNEEQKAKDNELFIQLFYPLSRKHKSEIWTLWEKSIDENLYIRKKEIEKYCNKNECDFLTAILSIYSTVRYLYKCNYFLDNGTIKSKYLIWHYGKFDNIISFIEKRFVKYVNQGKPITEEQRKHINKKIDYILDERYNLQYENSEELSKFLHTLKIITFKLILIEDIELKELIALLSKERQNNPETYIKDNFKIFINRKSIDSKLGFDGYIQDMYYPVSKIKSENKTNEINTEEINQQLETIEQINTKIDSEIKSINTNLSPKQLNFLVEGLIELGCIDEKNKGDLLTFLGIQNRKQSINTIKWKKSKMLCAYFVDKFNCDILNKDRIIWKPFEALFSQSKLVDSRNHYRNKTGDKPMGYKDINVLFEKILKE